MENKNIYIEFIGFSCIGKTYLRNKIYEDLVIKDTIELKPKFKEL